MKKFMPKIEYFLALVSRFWLIILIASVTCGFLGGALARISYQPEYETTQAFTIEVKAHPNANDATVNDNQLSKTIPALLSSETFMDHMTPIISKAGAKGKFKVTSLESSNIFYITCIASSNNDAQIIINEIQEHYKDLADHVIGESNMKFLAPASYSKLPINTPKYTLSAIGGILAGAIVVCLILVLSALLSNTVTNAEDIDSEINTKCLATVSKVYHKKRSESTENILPIVTDSKSSFEFKKSISTLSSNIYQKCSQSGLKSILITSTISGEGKSTIALNLAADLADKGQKVLLLDCDLRSPSIAKYIGLNDIENPLTIAIKTKSIKDCTIQTSIPNLFFCGNTSNNQTCFDTVNDSTINDLIKNAKEQFDFVIVDTAPVGFLGDAISISSGCDCFLYVISYNTVNKQSILRSISTLNDSNQNMIGFVLNNK